MMHPDTHMLTNKLFVKPSKLSYAFGFTMETEYKDLALHIYYLINKQLHDAARNTCAY